MSGAEQLVIIKRWKKLVAQETDDKLRADYVGLAEVFADLVQRDIWHQELQEFNVQQSKVVEGWKREARLEGETIGEAKGLAKAKAEAAALMQRRLRQYLEKQFNGNISPEFVAKIEAQQDLTILDHWLEAAIQANSLDEVRQALQLPSS